MAMWKLSRLVWKMVLISNAIFGWWIFKFWTVDHVSSSQKLFLVTRNKTYPTIYHCKTFWTIHILSRLLAGFLGVKRIQKGTNIQNAWCHDWHAKKQFKQAKTSDRQWKKNALTDAKLSDEWYVCFCCKGVCWRHPERYGRKCIPVYLKQKIYSLQSYLTVVKSWEKSPTLDLQIDPKGSCKFHMYTTCCFGPTQIIPSRLIWAVTKTLLICCI